MEDQISKKDLLQVTGISYGQLYRWKRMGLIPEEWFVRKSTFTGTETFFPRERVLARIEKIKSMQDDDLSLEAIADAVSPKLGEVALSSAEVLGRGIASQGALDIVVPGRRHEGPFVLGEVFALFVLEALLRDGSITADEGRTLVETMESSLSAESSREFEVLLVRKAGLSLWLLSPRSCQLRFEDSARVIARVDLAARLDELTSLLTQAEGKTK